MPRPGPRPYECVRRAWHSDRHQSMRGSIIQQIFRLVSERHSGGTRKNKEWQEKLPVVVLKAEEIMYSKANSEEEYMSKETLWDRVNEAINIIIRREEQTETGKLLPPCVEAALNLGCLPVKASRSQRHTNQRTYLSPRIQEPAPPSSRMPPPARNLIDTKAERFPQSPPFHSGNQNVDSALPVSPHTIHRTGAPSHGCSLPFGSSSNVPPGGSSWLMTKEAQQFPHLGTVYPLYYGDHYQYEEPRLVSQVADERAAPNTILLGKPIGTSVTEPAEMGVLQNFFAPDFEIASSRTTQAEYGNIHDNRAGTQCDLSLRLGFPSDPGMSLERGYDHETESQGRFNVHSQPNDQEFSFFPR